MKETGRRHYSELKRKAEEAHTRTCLQRESMRRATSDHVKAEEVLNNGGCLGTVAKDTAGATHAVTPGVPDRESNETPYVKEALDMINDWQSRCCRRRSESHDGQETTEEILVERPQ